MIRRDAVRQQRKNMVERLEAATKHAEEETKKAEADQERERRLRQELQEDIVNSAHDIKSPTTALSLAVESLLDALDNNKPISEAGRQRIVETLHGMAHSITALTMIINRSVDASNFASAGGRGFVPNKGLVDIEQLMDGVMAFSQWQAEDTGIDVVMEPLPADLPEEIMVDEKWLKDDLLCAASNAVKYCRANQGVPALIRVAIVPPPPSEKGAADVPSSPSVQFSFTDSGYPLSDEKLTNLFDRPTHSERTLTGGMGLGLFCLSEHITALDGKYGARRRTDGREGTEIWFSFPLIVPEAGQHTLSTHQLTHENFPHSHAISTHPRPYRLMNPSCNKLPINSPSYTLAVTNLPINTLSDRPINTPSDRPFNTPSDRPINTGRDPFVMHDAGHSGHASKTHHNRTLHSRDDTAEEEDGYSGTIGPTLNPDVPLFSSPQNRSRLSVRRQSSQKSSTKTSLPILELSRNSAHGDDPGGVVSGEDGGGGERSDVSDYNGVGGGVNGQRVRPITKDEAKAASPTSGGTDRSTDRTLTAVVDGVVTAVGGGIDVGGGGGGGVSFKLVRPIDLHPSGARKSTPRSFLITPRSSLMSPRRGRKSVQEVLGALPILLVDDSVSILKMTKRAILNECANIRSNKLSFLILLHLFS